MSVHGLQIILLMFALVGFAAAGSSMAAARHRLVTDGERDVGLAGIAVLFIAFAALCTVGASGLFGVIAFGGVAVWGGYLITAQRLGLFSIETLTAPHPEREPTEHR